MHHQSVTSTSETGGSELEDEYCSPVDVCLACMPMETLRCCTCQGRTSNSSKTHRQLWLHALILFVFAVALAGLAYYSMTLQNQLAVLSMHLDPGKIHAFWLSSQSQKSLPWRHLSMKSKEASEFIVKTGDWALVLAVAVTAKNRPGAILVMCLHCYWNSCLKKHF